MKLARIRHGSATRLARIEDGHAVLLGTETDTPRADVMSDAIATLEPGDVIATGTPDGVGFARKPPRSMTDGDVMTVWIDGIGELTNPCVVD
jgi:hypothetical protein